ncbi:DUF3080 family protein [Alteromonas sp. 1_MG-2023]|uniref:DUF3080 family protein n=1 Tax=Alteromonas sp. 1_MG-2023 TaxID=3062669 RepID=UPI0026E33714|nr:DUF3080 family protein [Alteromonas sp. 1_MG-2023]MDO6567475.1 DUF3080 family protein [Alteromonas sp. 1_MG-2023]
MHQLKHFIAAIATVLPVVLALLLSLVLLQGCFGPPSIDDTMDEYTNRLSRVLDGSLTEDIHKLENSALLKNSALNKIGSQTHALLLIPSQTYPSLSDVGNNVTTLNINIREFYAIQDCELGRIVAERNTALGKTQLPSQRLQYEHRVLNALANCEARLKAAEDPIATTVGEWRKQKQSQYESVWANVVQTSSEIKLGLSMAASPLLASGNKDAKASVNALNFVNSLSDITRFDATSEGGVIKDSEELEEQLQIVASSRLPAKLWQTQAVLHNRLLMLNETLPGALSEIDCSNGMNSDKAEILRNVFYLFFIEQIQPIASTLNSYHYQLQPLWQQWSDSEVLSEPFKAHIRTHGIDNFAEYSAVMHAHVSLWQDFLGRCNLSPTASGAN